MITTKSLTTQNINHCDQASFQDNTKAQAKPEYKQLGFFFIVAPMAVLTGWSLVGLCLTGNWAWELPMGLMFAIFGSVAAMVSTRLR